MIFRVAKRTSRSTAHHPWLGLGTIEEVAEYLQFDFDPDGDFKVPKNSVIRLSASTGRNSTYQGMRGIEIDLQPAVDVAHMIADYYWRSQVWPARVAFKVFSIMRELCVQRAFHRAEEFVVTFAEHRLGELISDSDLGIVEPHRPLIFSRSQMFGALDERELLKQLATFQIFHELSHLIASRHRRRSEQRTSDEVEAEELYCDEFGCSELERAYGGSLGIEFVESIPASIFLSILVWTLAQNFGRLDQHERRRQTLSTALRRSKAATVHAYRYAHRSEPPSERQEAEALRHFPAFEALLRIVDRFFTEAVSNDADMFNPAAPATEVAPVPPEALTATAAQGVRNPRSAWETTWEKEDKLVAEKADLLRPSLRAHQSRPRSRPILS